MTAATTCKRVLMVLGAPVAWSVGAATVGLLLFFTAVAGPERKGGRS